MLQRATIQKPKSGKCCHCKQQTTNRIGLKWCCDINHAIEFSNRAIARKKAKELKDDRKNLKARKDKIKPLSKWLQEAQMEFNKYIRLRDANKPCISCGCDTAIQWHAGHYRTTKAASHLRFNEDNCHKQCSQDNLYHSGKISEYRIRLIQRIGPSRVDSLENDNTPKKWTVDELKALKAHYSALTRALNRISE